MEVIDIKEYRNKIKKLSELSKTVKPLFDKMNEDNKKLKYKNNKLNYNN